MGKCWAFAYTCQTNIRSLDIEKVAARHGSCDHGACLLAWLLLLSQLPFDLRPLSPLFPPPPHLSALPGGAMMFQQTLGFVCVTGRTGYS